MTFLGEQPEVDEDRIGIYGTSYGGAHRGLDRRHRPARQVRGQRRRHRQRHALDEPRPPAWTSGSTFSTAPRPTASSAP